MLTHDQWMTLHTEAHRLDGESVAVLTETARALRVLGPNSRALVGDIVRRLVVGMPLGDWNRPLDLVANAVEESVDGIDYLVVERRRVQERLSAIENALSKAIELDGAIRAIPPDPLPPAEPMHAGG